MTFALPIEVHPLLQADLNLIFSSWIGGIEAQKKGQVKRMSSMLDSDGVQPRRYESLLRDFFDRNWLTTAQQSLIEALLRAPTTEVMVAAQPGRRGQLYGFIVGWPSARVLHWIFTKRDFRRQHVASRLMEAMFGEPGDPIEASTSTPSLRHLDRWRVHIRTYRLCEVTKCVTISS